LKALEKIITDRISAAEKIETESRCLEFIAIKFL
jgi:hypothetical protein